VNDDATELRKPRFEPFPNPPRQNLAGRIFQAADFVQVVMVELLPDRTKGGVHVSKVDDPAGLRVGLSTEVDGHLERVSVQARAFVTDWDPRQSMSRFEPEFAKDLRHAAKLSEPPIDGTTSVELG
jgi:hypothetical protein